jgi:hypothetical protein
MAAVELGENGLCRFGPDEGFGWPIVLGEINIDGGLQIADRVENAATDALLRHLREDTLDRIQPGGRGWDEVKGNHPAVVETDALLARSLERRACHRLRVCAGKRSLEMPSRAIRAFYGQGSTLASDPGSYR